MAFINEELTHEQKEKFMNRGIKPPESIPSIPVCHTIDKDLDISLTHLCVYGRDDWNHHYFVFDWKNETHLVLLEYVDAGENTVVWKISDKEKNLKGYENFLDDLGLALMVYAVNGRPSQRGNTNIRIEIKKGEWY